MDATNQILSIIAFYLSEYDMEAVEALGFRTRNEAINIISSKIGKGNNYLKLRRDEFDALPDSSSSRKGWRNRPPIKDVTQMAAYLHQFSFAELTDIIEPFLESDIVADKTYETFDISLPVDDIDEGELERIINFSDANAKIEITTRTGKQRIYKQSIIMQLKNLYRGSCQICGFNPTEAFGTSICEAHHIDFFSKSHNNNANNIVILCPNHHRLIHKLNPEFDAERLAFTTNSGENLTIKLNYHLK